MKKCTYCSKEIQNEAVKCKHCGKLLVSPTGSAGIWNRYWGYIISIPIIIVCVAYMISSIANLTKSEELALQDSNPLLAEQSAPRPAEPNHQISWQSSTSSTIDNRPTSWQSVTKMDDGKPSPNNNAYTAQTTDANYQIARQSATSSEMDNRQTSEQPATNTYDRNPSPNDEAYKPSSVADGKKKNQNQERLHEQQKRQLDSLYR